MAKGGLGPKGGLGLFEPMGDSQLDLTLLLELGDNWPRSWYIEGEVDPSLSGVCCCSVSTSNFSGDCPKILSILKFEDNFFVLSDFAIINYGFFFGFLLIAFFCFLEINQHVLSI